MAFAIGVGLGFGLMILALDSCRRSRPVERIEVRDTVIVWRRVEVPVVRYRTVPRVVVRRDTLRGLERVMMEHDTVTARGDSIRVRAEYPPPRLFVYFRMAPLGDSIRVGRVQSIDIPAPARSEVRQWDPLTVFVAGAVVGYIVRGQVQ